MISRARRWSARLPRRGPRRPLAAAARSRCCSPSTTPSDRAMEAASLARIGHAVTTVATGREAVTMATWHAYDAIVIDLRLRDMDALAATRAIRGSAGPCAEAIIIALSDDASPERKRFYDGAGFSHVLAKPGKHALAARLDAIAAILASPGRSVPRDRAGRAARRARADQRIARAIGQRAGCRAARDARRRVLRSAAPYPQGVLPRGAGRDPRRGARAEGRRAHASARRRWAASPRNWKPSPRWRWPSR